MGYDKCRKCGVFVTDRSIAENIINREITKRNGELVKYIHSQYDLFAQFVDGTCIEWLRPSDSVRGHKCGKAIIDLDIDQEVLQKIVIPCCIFCTPYDFTLFDSVYDNDDIQFNISKLIDRLMKIRWLVGDRVVEVYSHENVEPARSICSYDNKICITY